MKYRASGRLTAHDVSTFVSVVFNRLRRTNPRSKGYLYTTVDLQEDLADDFIYGNAIDVHVWNPFDAAAVPDEPPSAPIELTEADYTLRPYQQEALEALVQFDVDQSPMGVLAMPCGTGKTTVCGKYLQVARPKLAVYIAPLIALVEQNMARMRTFVPDAKMIHIHTGPCGTTDTTALLDAIRCGETVFVGATYDSFADVLAPLPEVAGALVVVDEAHNVISESRRVIGALATMRTILVTATPPTAFQELASEIFTFHLRDAIRQGYICDYTLFVNDIHLDPDYEMPDELGDIDKTSELAGKALYLVNNMLLKGSRRCIVMLRTHEEVATFRAFAERVAREYHAHPIRTGEVIATTRERDTVFHEFQRCDNESKLYILCSVRILDEGIDLPKCDSVFVTNVTDATSTIRMVQRMCRANRLDSTRAHKIAHIFLWTQEDFVNILHVLDVLRESDPEFIKHIHYASLDYTLTMEERTTREAWCHDELERYSAINALTLEEKARR